MDNPIFSESIASVHDAPKSSGSSTSSGLQQRSCAKCPSRMSSVDRDKHLNCIKCRGYECSVELRCEECKDWSKEEMLAHEKIRKSLASKSKGRGKSSSKSNKKPASSPSTSVTLDLEDRFEAQHNRMLREMDERMELLSSSLLGQIKNLIGFQDFNPNPNANPNSHDALVFPGRASYHTVPEPPQPQTKTASVRSRESLVSEGGTGAWAAGVAHARVVDESLPKARAAQAPIFHGENRDFPAGSSGTEDRREWSYEDDGMDDDDDELEDRDHAAEPPLDRAFARLVDYIYERFPHSEPQSAAPRCEYETYFAVADLPEPARKFMRLYPRVSEIQKTVHDYATNLSWESRPLFRVLPSRHRAFSIGDEPDFCRQRFINSDFARICRSKSVAKSRMVSVSLADLERLDRVSRMILAGDSQCYWFLSALLVQLKEDGYQLSNPSLFDKSISSLSSALATQTNVTSCLSEFITAKRRESYLSHSSFTLPESLKRDLLVAPGTDSLLFNQPLLSSAIENMKEDSLLSSTSSLASISKAAIKSKSQGGSGKCAFPFDAPRAGTSGFHKRSSSPYRRGSKRGRGGRGAAPSSSRGRGFRR